MRPTILLGIKDRWRTKRNGEKFWVGQVLILQDGNWRVMAQVFSDSLLEMRRRKMAVYSALKREAGRRERMTCGS